MLSGGEGFKPELPAPSSGEFPDDLAHKKHDGGILPMSRCKIFIYLKKFQVES